MAIYKSQKGREKSLELYDKQLMKLGKEYSDIYIKTSFGKTHIVETNKGENYVYGNNYLITNGGILYLLFCKNVSAKKTRHKNRPTWNRKRRIRQIYRNHAENNSVFASDHVDFQYRTL